MSDASDMCTLSDDSFEKRIDGLWACIGLKKDNILNITARYRLLQS